MSDSVKHAKLAANAMVNLNMFSAISEMTENGLLRGGDISAASKIRTICKKEMQRQLYIYDKHISEIERLTHEH